MKSRYVIWPLDYEVGLTQCGSSRKFTVVADRFPCLLDIDLRPSSVAVAILFLLRLAFHISFFPLTFTIINCMWFMGYLSVIRLLNPIIMYVYSPRTGAVIEVIILRVLS